MANKHDKFLKDPEADLDFGWDWGKEWLDEDNIVSSSWEVDEGITVLSQSHSGRITVIWLSGGEEGQTYNCTNTILTETGRKDERTFRVKVSNR